VTDEPDSPVDKAALRIRLRALAGDQRIAFLMVGTANTVFGFALFVFFDFTIGRAVDARAGTVAGSLATLVCSHVLAVLLAFVLYRRFVFKVRGHILRDLARFESVYLTAFGINAVALPFLTSLGVNRILAQASIIGITTVVSYVGHRHFSFRRTPTEE